MALTDVGTSKYRLANSQMSGTITTFGSGKANTQTLIGTNNLYFTLRKQIVSKANKGWLYHQRRVECIWRRIRNN